MSTNCNSLTVVRLRKQKRIHYLGFGNQLGNEFSKINFSKTVMESNEEPLYHVSNVDRILYKIWGRLVIHGRNVYGNT